MRGFYDELGGPGSIADPSEWGSSMTAAGLPASPGVAPSALPSDVLAAEAVAWARQSPSEDTLRQRQIAEITWTGLTDYIVTGIWWIVPL